MFILTIFFVILSITCKIGLGYHSRRSLEPPIAQQNEDDWKGKWFPSSPDDNDSDVDLAGMHVKMGVIDDYCDNGKTNLTMDWNDSPINYTCFEPKSLYWPNTNVQPVEINYHIPTEYIALHRCMTFPINYDERIPTFGTHRPLWAKYGEYVFVPVQRWLHNLEHGAIVMLYHPCANRREVQYLKEIVSNCLYRHIVTPYTLLSMERPLALVAWGYSLEISKVDVPTVVDFIRRRGLRGPERISRDGQYDYYLINPARVILDEEVSSLCMRSPNN